MDIQPKKVSIPLIIGIVCIPLFFAWFTLRKGYSKKARIVSFGYLIFTFILFASLPSNVQQKRATQDTPPQAIQAKESEPEEAIASEPQAVVKKPEPVVAEPKTKVEGQPTTVESEPKVTVKEETKQNQTGLKLTPEQFFKNYNKEASSIGSQGLSKFKYLNDGKTVKFDLYKDFYVVGQIDKHKNLEKVMVGLVLLEKNKNKFDEQTLSLLNIGQIALGALDNNKIDAHRDNIVRDIHSDLIDDPETASGNNSKVASYRDFSMSIAYIPEIGSVVFTFQPRN